MYQGPNQPRKPRIPAPQPPADIEELEETAAAPAEVIANEETPAPAPTVPADIEPEPADVEPTSADTGEIPSPVDGEEKPKKRGRPAGSKSAPKPTTPAPKNESHRKKQDDVDLSKKIRTALYLWPNDHKRLKMLCVDIDVSMTEFGEAACLAAMYSSYQCAAPDCNCEFVIRSSLSDAMPSCPMCGGKKLSRPYLP